MKSKKTAPKKITKKTIQAQNGVTAFTWFLFSIFLVVSFFCIKFIKQAESQSAPVATSAPIITTTVSRPTAVQFKPIIQKVTPKVIKK